MLKPQTCKPCPLYTLGNSFSKPEGKGRKGVICIGEALGHDESIDGLPFRPKAQAGSKLEEAFRLGGFERNDFLLWNVIACQPPENKLVGQWYADRAIATCSQYLKRVINEFSITDIHNNNLHLNTNPKRKVILALGSTAFTTLTGSHLSILDIRGYAFCCKWDSNLTVVATLHPSYIKRGNGHLTPLLVEDIKKAVEIARQDEWEVPRQMGPYVVESANTRKNNEELESMDDSVPF